MRNSALLKWAQNMNKSGKENKNWIHPPEQLQRGHIVYLVRFMGSIGVDQPKGFNVVREAIRKLRFNQQVRKITEGTKLPKVELTVSIDGITIQEPKSKAIMHQYPLYRISYCADDKVEKQYISFIVKEPDSEQHTCFVFISEKLSEEITMTIGQAFELAYKVPSPVKNSTNHIGHDEKTSGNIKFVEECKINKMLSTTNNINNNANNNVNNKSNKLSFRARQLDVNKPLVIYMAEDLPDLMETLEIKRAVPLMPSGMEKDEECEHHLQRAMVTRTVIPTPEVEQLKDLYMYALTYTSNYKQPKQLIRMQPFAYEEGAPEYDADSEDEQWLSCAGKSLNLSKEKFEEMIDKLDNNSNYSVITLNDTKLLLNESEDIVTSIYDYWLSKRLRLQHSLIPNVKTEVRAGSANDPYIAFRRRKDKMQTRKNRKNDECSYETTCRLMKDLVKCKQLFHLILDRERQKQQLAVVTRDIFTVRYKSNDYDGSMVREVLKDLKVVPKVPSLPPDQLVANKLVCNWPKIKASKEIKKSPPHFPAEVLPKREKRQYKRRKLKTAQDTTGVNIIEEKLPTGYSDMIPDEGEFAFRRSKNCSYLAPTNYFSNDESIRYFEDPSQNRCCDFYPTYVSHPETRYIGLARRRIGRGGRMILDRAGPTDDLWTSLGWSIIESRRMTAPSFRPKTPPISSDESSDNESDFSDSSKPIIEIENTSPRNRGKTRIRLEVNFNDPLKSDSSCELMNRIAAYSRTDDIVENATINGNNSSKTESRCSILDRWEKTKKVENAFTSSTNSLFNLGNNVNVIGCSSFKSTTNGCLSINMKRYLKRTTSANDTENNVSVDGQVIQDSCTNINTNKKSNVNSNVTNNFNNNYNNVHNYCKVSNSPNIRRNVYPNTNITIDNNSVTSNSKESKHSSILDLLLANKT